MTISPSDEEATDAIDEETTGVEAPIEVADTSSRNWATLTHLSAFVMFFGIPSPVGPLVAWLLKSEDPETVAVAKEALNFNISYLFYMVVSGLLMFVLIGFVLLPIVVIAWFVLVILAAVRSSEGEVYRYPFTLRLIN